NASLGLLAYLSRCSVSPGEHVVRRHRRMPDETDFGPGSEEARAHAVFAVLRRENECRIRIVELARDREHLRFREAVRIEHNPGWVTGEAITREGIELVNLDLSCHASILNLFGER